MKRCPGCRRELVWESRVLAVIDESVRWDALLACSGCLAVVCLSVRKGYWGGPAWPKGESASLELPGAASARAIDALRAQGAKALDRLSRDARSRIVLRVPEVAEVAHPLFFARARLVRNAMTLAWDWQRILTVSQPRFPIVVVPDLESLVDGRLGAEMPPSGLVGYTDLRRLSLARLEALPFRATNQRALARGEVGDVQWAVVRMPDLPRDLQKNGPLGIPSPTALALRTDSTLPVRGRSGPDLVLELAGATLRAPLDLLEPAD